eukprot:GFUD01001557.1.p1 GENE.GFUD01001557.1~~GFUD01001557.1.p1  ORF type:complete len:483 (-),score=172.49 GFUD01001557.1:107-1555(-)
MPPVTCYVCGRDFGTKSIGIHLPKCKQRWEAEQEKLPKKEKRPVPTAPEDFDKVVKGEIKGKDLVKINQKAFDEHNESGLEACQHCGRTFLPKALLSHHNACTEEKPMVKNKGPGHASQLKAKVNYPKLKTKKGNKSKEGKPESKTSDESKVVSKVPEEEVKTESHDTFNLVEKVPTSGRSKPPLLAGGSSRVHGVFALLPKDVKEKIRTEEEECSTSSNTCTKDSPMVKTENSSPIQPEREKEEESQNLSEEEWILVNNPQATREFIDDMKQKILQCVNSSPPSEGDSEEKGEDESAEEEQSTSVSECDDPSSSLEESLDRRSNLSSKRNSLILTEDTETEYKLGTPSFQSHEAVITTEEIKPINDADNSEENPLFNSKSPSPTSSIADQPIEDDKTSGDENEQLIKKEEFPTRKDIVECLEGETLYEQEEHRVKIMELIRNYVKDVKKNKILDILDNHVFEDEDSMEDAVFLMSEILYSK